MTNIFLWYSKIVECTHLVSEKTSSRGQHREIIVRYFQQLEFERTSTILLGELNMNRFGYLPFSQLWIKMRQRFLGVLPNQIRIYLVFLLWFLFTLFDSFSSTWVVAVLYFASASFFAVLVIKRRQKNYAFELHPLKYVSWSILRIRTLRISNGVTLLFRDSLPDSYTEDL